MSERIGRLAVIGLGLLGGSLAWGARRRGLAGEVVGWGRRPQALEAAQAKGVVERIAPTPREAAKGADLVVLATPVGAMAEVLAEAAAGLEPGAVVTDVGSVKAPIAEAFSRLLPTGVVYVGSHPMAGGHAGGVEHADPDLFEGATCVLVPPRGGKGGSAALARVRGLWEGLGARAVERDPEAHDREVAWISHLPHVLAFAFARALGGAPGAAAELCGPGFRDFTRIAWSDPELWSDILVANRTALATAMGRLVRELNELAQQIEAGERERLGRALAQGRARLSAFGSAPRDAASGERATQGHRASSGPHGGPGRSE